MRRRPFCTATLAAAWLATSPWMANCATLKRPDALRRASKLAPVFFSGVRKRYQGLAAPEFTNFPMRSVETESACRLNVIAQFGSAEQGRGKEREPLQCPPATDAEMPCTSVQSDFTDNAAE